jgi:hypothetical protein
MLESGGLEKCNVVLNYFYLAAKNQVHEGLMKVQFVLAR